MTWSSYPLLLWSTGSLSNKGIKIGPEAYGGGSRYLVPPGISKGPHRPLVICPLRDVFPYLRNGGKNEKLNINFSKLNYVNFLSFRHVVLFFHAWRRPCMKKAVLNDQFLRFSFQFKKLDVSYNVRSQYLYSLMPFFLSFNVFNEPRAKGGGDPSKV